VFSLSNLWFNYRGIFTPISCHNCLPKCNLICYAFNLLACLKLGFPTPFHYIVLILRLYIVLFHNLDFHFIELRLHSIIYRSIFYSHNLKCKRVQNIRNVLQFCGIFKLVIVFHTQNSFIQSLFVASFYYFAILISLQWQLSV